MDRLAKYEARPITPAASTAVMIVMLSCAIGLCISMILVPPTAWMFERTITVDGAHLWSALRSGAIGLTLLEGDLLRELAPRLAGCGVAMLLSGLIAFRMKLNVTPIVDTRKHEDGLQLRRGKAAVASANEVLAREREGRQHMIQIAPGVAISRSREARNLLLLGAIGSGKTRIILFLIDELLRRLLGDRQGDHALFVHDTTGEILDGFPMAEGTFAVLHPHRPGGYAWNMGADLVDDEDCASTAEQMVEQTGEAIWGKGGATLFAGCLILTKAMRGRQWSAPELYRVCLADPAKLKKHLERHYRPAADLIEIDGNGELNKTSISFLLTFRASVLRVLRPLAKAWTDVPAERYFSFSAWVRGDKADQPRVVIVQRSGRHPEMSAGWIGMVIDVITSAVGDPVFGVSRTRTRCFVLDEAPALGRLLRWPNLLDTARNKGVSTIAAIQDTAQFKRIYGDAAASIFERFLTKIVCAQTYGPEAAHIAETEIRTRTIRKQEVTKTIERGPAGKNETISISERTEEVPIVRPEYLAFRLGVLNRRIRALVVGMGDILELEWPIRAWRMRR